MDTSIESLFTCFVVFVLCGCCLCANWAARKTNSHEHIEAIDLRDFQRRRDLMDTEIEAGRIEWHCIVCAHLNHPDYSSCVLCGSPAKAAMASSVELMSTDHEQELSDRCSLTRTCLLRMESNDSEELTVDSRQRALRYRRLNQMQLNQRQRGAQRRHLWQRAHLPEGKYVWVRVGSTTNDSFITRIARKSRLLRQSSSMGSASKKALLKKGSSIGFITDMNESGVVSWQKADSFAIQIDDNTDAEVLGDASNDFEGVVSMKFSQKQRWFVRKLSNYAVPFTVSMHSVHIHRGNMLEESVDVVTSSDADQRTLEHLKITFDGEPGLDAGGVLREWFSLVCKELFSVDKGLFRPTHAENMAYWINPHSAHAVKDHLKYFKFAGRLFGKAMLDNLCFDAHLALPLLKHWLGVPISFSDLEFLDEEIYKSSCWIRDNDGVDALCLTFCVTTELGETVDLKPNGRGIDVTDENKSEYLMLLLRYYMLDSVSAQLQALLSGLYEIVPRSLLSVFDYQELDFFLCGLPTINVSDWQRHTVVFGSHQNDSDQQDSPVELSDQEYMVLIWFWDVVEVFSDEERARLLQFATGSSRVPVEGFKALMCASGIISPFTIQLVERGVPPAGLCPKAHTCFNRIDLPLYESPEELQNYLSLVIQMEITGYDFE